MIILQVSMQEMNPAQINDLERHFHRFFSKEKATVEYPVSCDSHGLDVFTDNFELGTIHEGRVYGAWLIELPLEPEDFTPFDEENAGTTLAEWAPVNGFRTWDFFPAAD